jgi:hypothetical protein
MLTVYQPQQLTDHLYQGLLCTYSVPKLTEGLIVEEI